MIKSVYGKLFLGFVATIVISFMITGMFAFHQSKADTTTLASGELEKSSEHISDLVERISKDDLYKILSDYSQTSELNFDLRSDRLKMSYGHFDRNVKLSEKQVSYLQSHVGKSITNMVGTKIAYAKSFNINNRVYVICVQKDSSDTQKTYLTSYILAGIILFIAGSLIFLVVSDFIVKPISELTKATNELGKGNYNVRVNYAGDDEIAKLNNAFNQMAIQLAKQEETRQQFISDVSHEFQTPLTAIGGFANILMTENLPDDQRKKYAEIILSNSKRLSTLSKNMLQLATLEGDDTKLDKSSYSLIAQLNRAIETQDYSALLKDIEIEFIKPRGDLMVEADESRMEQVWTNLINNAIKYTKEHGVITVEVKKSGSNVIVNIQDTGIGMSKETISHIFERFYRDDKSRAIEGNGLGLAIVARIISLHGFTLDVQSQEDVGSIFSVKMLLYVKRLAPRFNEKKE